MHCMLMKQEALLEHKVLQEQMDRMVHKVPKGQQAHKVPPAHKAQREQMDRTEHKD